MRFGGRTDSLDHLPRSFAFVGWLQENPIKETQGPTQSFTRRVFGVMNSGDSPLVLPAFLPPSYIFAYLGEREGTLDRIDSILRKKV